jgi:hypothetical protein
MLSLPNERGLEETRLAVSPLRPLRRFCRTHETPRSPLKTAFWQVAFRRVARNAPNQNFLHEELMERTMTGMRLVRGNGAKRAFEMSCESRKPTLRSGTR